MITQKKFHSYYVTWRSGRCGLVGFLRMLLWRLSRTCLPAEQLPLHLCFFDIAASLSQQNNTIQHFQCYQSAESDRTTMNKMKAERITTKKNQFTDLVFKYTAGEQY